MPFVKGIKHVLNTNANWILLPWKRATLEEGKSLDSNFGKFMFKYMYCLGVDIVQEVKHEDS